MTTTASPVAAARPASVAAGWPKRREKRSSLTRGSPLAQVEDALLGAVGATGRAEKMISQSTPVRSRTAAIRS